jgi:hypothetical protein
MRLTSDGRDGSAYHGIELLEQSGKKMREWGRSTRGAWAVFAKDPENRLRKYGGGWPAYEPGEKTMVR